MKTATKNPVKAEKVQGTKTSAKAKSLKAKEALDDKNIKDTVKTIVESERDIKYNYPEEIDNTLDRKAWRQKVRNTLRAFERNLGKLDAESKEYRKLNREYKEYRKDVLLVP